MDKVLSGKGLALDSLGNHEEAMKHHHKTLEVLDKKGVKLVRAKSYYELCEKCKREEDEGKIETGSGKGKAIGAVITIIIIVLIIAAVANRLYQRGIHTDKLLELGCTPEAWNQFGGVTFNGISSFRCHHFSYSISGKQEEI